MSLKVSTLEDLCTLITDGAHWSPKDNEEGYFMPSVKDMTEYGFDYTNSKKISKEDYLKLKNSSCCPEEGDVLIAKDGSYLKHCFAYNGEDEIAILSSIAIFRPNTTKIHSKYLEYLFRTPYIKSLASGYVSGVAVPRIVLKDFKTIKLPIPSLHTQEEIIRTINNYDGLIVNNLKRINLLEQAAQYIYKEWFVNMRFPGHEIEEFDSETGIPINWIEVNLEFVCEKISSGGTPSRQNSSYWNEAKYNWVTTKELKDSFILNTKESISQEGLDNSSAKLFPSGSILMAIYASPTLGRLGILSEESCFNQAAVGFICKTNLISNEFLFYKLLEERDNLNAIAIGAAQQNINVGKVKNHKILLPNITIIEEYSSLVKPSFEMRLKLTKMNEKLKQARDILLPRLMNQTIEV